MEGVVGHRVDERVRRQTMPRMFNGSRYASRLPIGTVRSLQTMTPEALRRFYRDWYRPELEAVVVVGEVNPDLIEQRIKALFADLPAPVKPRVRPERIDIPPRTAPDALLVTDAELPSGRLDLTTYVRPQPSLATIGAYDALQTMATQAFMGRRPEEFTKQFIAALKILQEGHATRASMRSSWAGAMGYTQFMPTDFENFGVDFDSDGKRDIWNSIPDALASTGNSLHSQGWDGSKTWAYEVTLPADFDCSLQGPDLAKPISEWMKLGIARVKGKEFPKEKLGDNAFLVLPAGLKGPAFLATDNFSVLKLYNNSDVYAIFVGHIADMIASNEPVAFVGAWQPVERFPRDSIQRFQQALVNQGYDVGKVDGLSGFKTRRSIGLEEKKRGLPLTCYPSSALVDAVLKEAETKQ